MKISCLNPIAAVGMQLFTDAYEKVDDFATSDAALVRSASVHELELPDQLLAIARAGAGVNNIPLDKCAEKGIKMGVITNGPYAHQVRKFYTLGLDKWFSMNQLIVSAGVGVAKPDIRIFQMAEEKWGMIPEQTYMIGDSLENDIQGARNAGWKTIWMNHHRYSVPKSMKAPDYIVYTEEEMKNLILDL